MEFQGASDGDFHALAFRRPRYIPSFDLEHNKNTITDISQGQARSGEPTVWIGSSRDDLRAFPDEVRRVMGFAINDAQNAAMSILVPRR